MPTSLLRAAIAASERASAAALVLSRVAERHDAKESTIDEMHDEASEAGTEMLFAAERARRAMVDFHASRSGERRAEAERLNA